MKPYTKAAAVTAAKWALGLSAGFILGPFVIGLGKWNRAIWQFYRHKACYWNRGVSNYLFSPLGLGLVIKERPSDRCSNRVEKRNDHNT